MTAPVRADQAAAPPLFAARMRLFYFGYFLTGGIMLPFFPIWLQGRGLSEVEIANVIAIPAFIRVFLTPLAGLYADRAPNRRFATLSFTLPAAIMFLAAWPSQGYLALLLATGIPAIIWGLAMPPAEALALTGVRRFGLDYGRMRLTGSLGFITANLGSGALLGVLPTDAIFWFIFASLAASTVVSFTLPVTPRQIRAIDDAAKPDQRPAWSVLGNGVFLAILLASGLVQASHAMLYSFGSIEWIAVRYTGFQIGLLWSAGIVCEVAMFIWSTALLRRVSPYGFVIVGTVAAVVRWAAFPFAPDLWMALILQALHGLTFGATYVGVQHLIARMVPDEMTASAQGIYAMMTGILLAVATALSGPLYAASGGAAFAWMAVPPAVALVVLLFARPRLRSA